MADVSTQLEQARKELLYLGLRNPLLNYRPLKARGAEIEEARPLDLYQSLVLEKKSGSFESRENRAEGGNGKKKGLRFPTDYDEAELDKRLHKTFYTAQAYIEEQGINILYLALGMLRWRERETADVVRRAPLVLVPITMSRPNAKDRYQIRYSGTDITTNLSLEAKLRLDFGLELPLVPEGDEFDLAAYFADVSDAIMGQLDWAVDETAVSLGFFSFNKFLMYHDLDSANWPEGIKPDQNDVLQALLTPRGFQELPPVVTDDELIDPHIDLQKSHLVVEADSSQLRAILDVNHGRNLVIQGPPGTGKSQTITNLIAEAVGNGKTVLFVSEKMAALNVVKRKLDQVGLGGAALALHSHTTTKRTFAEELGRTLSLGQPHEKGVFPKVETLTQTRDQLNGYSSAMNSPIGDSLVTPFFGYGRLIELDERLRETGDWQAVLRTHLSSYVYGTVGQWSAPVYDLRRESIGEAQTLLAEIGSPAQHPFSGTTAQENVDEDEIRQLIGAWRDAVDDQLSSLAIVAEAMKLPVPETVVEGEKLADIGRRAVSAPNLYAVDSASPDWHGQADALRTAVELGVQLSVLRNQYDHVLIPEAWEQDLFALRAPLIRWGERWWRGLSGEYRQVQAQLAGLCRQEPPKSGEEQLALVDAILEYRRVLPEFLRYEPLLQKLFGLRYTGVVSIWPELDEVRRWLGMLHEEIFHGRLATDMLRYIAEGLTHDERLRLQPIVNGLTTADEALNQASTRAIIRLSLPQLEPDKRYEELLAELGRYETGAPRFGEMVTYNRFVARMPELGVGPWAKIMRHWPYAGTHLLDLFAHVCYTALIERGLLEKQALSGFAGEAQTSAVARFGELDRLFLHHNRYKLAYQHWSLLPEYGAGGQVGILLNEVEKKTNHQPIRQTMSRAAYAIQTIKPIFMMSPLSIAMFLPPGEIMFDLVIFDEASQVRPVDAFGALVRGRQVVVVGDSRQLPPTTFFDRVLSDGDSDEDEEDTLIGSNESILDLFVAQGAPQQMLHWHYRSQHESLIAISNQEFYDNQLVLYPSPDADRDQVGLRLHHNRSSSYARGKSRTNQIEAEQVAQAVVAHVRTQPGLTLGVATFSSAQREAIAQAVEALRVAQPELESFFQAHPHEPFFVKNLENVQGDERDVMLISIGYGRGEDGKVRLNFGPLNSDGGERRLNVLITRARRRCEIFTNLTADDLDLRRTQSKGVAALKAYLHYAETGELAELPPNKQRTVSPFERVVAGVLRDAGYDVVHRVGLGGVEVDLAVRENGRYLFGVELDGEDYHLAKSARDRDRIQAEVLARLGWRIVRVWSTDWLRDPLEQRALLLAELTKEEAEQDEIEGSRGVLRYDRAALQDRVARPYVRARVDFDGKSVRTNYRREVVGEWFAQLVAVEGPVSIEVASRHICLLDGHKRNFITAHTAKYAINHMVGLGRFEKKGEYLYPVGMLERQAVPVRDWGELPKATRKFANVSKEEIGEALRLRVKDALRISVHELPTLVSRLLGFGHIGRRNRQRIVEALLDMIWRGVFVYLPETQEVALARHGEGNGAIPDDVLASLKEMLVHTPTKKTSKNEAVPEDWLTPDDVDLDPYPITEFEAGSGRYSSLVQRPGWTSMKHFGGSTTYWGKDGEVYVPASGDVLRTSVRLVYEAERDVYTAVRETELKTRKTIWESLTGSGDERPSLLAASVFYDLRTGRFFAQGRHQIYDQQQKPVEAWRDGRTGRFFKHLSPVDASAGTIAWLDPISFVLTETVENSFHLSSPYVRWGREIDVTAEVEAEVRETEIGWLTEILSQESPIHEKLLAQRFATLGNYSRPTDLVNDFMNQLLDYAAERGLFERRGLFIWSRQGAPLLYDWREVPKGERKLEYVSIEGVAEAIRTLVAEDVALEMSDLANAIASLFGTRPPTSTDKKRVAFGFKWLVEQGFLRVDEKEDGSIMLGEPVPNWLEDGRLSMAYLAEPEPADPERPTNWMVAWSRRWPLYEQAMFRPEITFKKWDRIIQKPECEAWVLQIVATEKIIQLKELWRRLQDLTCVGTSKIELFESLAERLHDQGSIRFEGGFLYEAGLEDVEPRYRHYFAGNLKDMELVAPLEIEAAVAQILTAVGGQIAEDELAICVVLAFFGSRLQGKHRERVREIIGLMVANGCLVRDGTAVGLLTNDNMIG